MSQTADGVRYQTVGFPNGQGGSVGRQVLQKGLGGGTQQRPGSPRTKTSQHRVGRAQVGRQEVRSRAHQLRAAAGDVLNIEVLEDASLNRQALVLPDGRVTVPLAGNLPKIRKS